MRSIYIFSWLGLALADSILSYIMVGDTWRYETNPIVRPFVKAIGADTFIILALLACVVAYLSLKSKFRWIPLAFSILILIELYCVGGWSYLFYQYGMDWQGEGIWKGG